MLILDVGGTDEPRRSRPFGLDNDVTWPEPERFSPAPVPVQPVANEPRGLTYQGMKPGWFPGATEPYYYPSFEWNSGSRTTNYQQNGRRVTLEALRSGTGTPQSRANMSFPPTSRPSTPYLPTTSTGMSYPAPGSPYGMSHPAAGSTYGTPTSGSPRAIEGNLPEQMYYGPGGTLAQYVEQGLGLNLIPYDEEDPYGYIGYAQDWGPGSWVIKQVGDGYRKYVPTYRRGQEVVNPQISMQWSPQQVTDWRAQVRYLSQFIDFGSSAPMGTNANTWTEGDAAAMEWLMAYANETGLDVVAATNEFLTQAESGNLDPGLFGGSSGSGSGAAPPPPERRVDRSFSLSDLDGARALIASQMRALLGRDPSDQEVSGFLSALNAREKTTPSVTTTEYEYDEYNQMIGSTTTSDPADIDRTAMARRAALAGNEREMERFMLGQAQDVISRMVGL